jgi:hypothetical protein
VVNWRHNHQADRTRGTASSVVNVGSVRPLGGRPNRYAVGGP